MFEVLRKWPRYHISTYRKSLLYDEENLTPTTIRHLPGKTVHHLYDDLLRWHGPLANKLLMQVRTEFPGLHKGLKQQRAVLELVLAKHKDVYRDLVSHRG